MHTIKPLDEALVLRCARETRLHRHTEEHNIIGCWARRWPPV
jgi:transketolase